MVPAKYRARAPDKTWHELCETCADVYAEKYSEAYLIDDTVRANLLSGRAPFDRRGKPR